MAKKTWRVRGMACPHCEINVCRAVSGLPGISEPAADFRRGLLAAEWDRTRTSEKEVDACLREAGYALAGREIPARLLGFLALAGLCLWLFAFTPVKALLSAFPVAREGMTLGALFSLGLMTSLHCIGMCGGINLGQSAGAARAGASVLSSNLQYNLGRLLSYTLTGALAGALGSAVRFGTGLQAAVQMAAALGMCLMALSLLGVTGQFLPHFSGRVRARLLARGKISSLWVGLLNGLMPCGPLQAMQLVALAAGSAVRGALSMAVFCLGTMPLMLGFGVLSGHLNKRFAGPVRTLSGIVLVIMSMSMLTNGMALLGLGSAGSAGISQADTASVQEIRSELEWRGYPEITVQAGVPVRWVIHAGAEKITGCNNEMVIPGLDLRVPLQPGDNVVEFVANSPGVIPYTCWMGMLHGSITVTP